LKKIGRLGEILLPTLRTERKSPQVNRSYGARTLFAGTFL
jgi:hypothetical protein